MSDSIILGTPKDTEKFRARALMMGLPLDLIPEIYSDSIETTCMGCTDPIMLGPRCQEMLKEVPDARVFCFFCGAQTVIQEGGTTVVQSLGNPEHGS